MSFEALESWPGAFWAVKKERMRFLSAIVLVAVTASACSTKKDTLGDAQLADVKGFCAEWANRACNDQVVSRCAAESKDAWAAAQQSFCESLVPDGEYSALTASTCLEAVSAGYADAVLTADERDTVRKLGPPCDKIRSGSTGKGGDCTEDSDCNRDVDLACVKKAGNESGKCETPTTVSGGISCADPDVVCDDGFYCDGSHCVEAVGSGASCSGGVPCKADFQCVTAGGTPLDGSADGGASSGTCAPLKKTGEAGGRDGDCVSRICAPRINSPSGVCAEQILLTPSESICIDL